MNPQFEYVEGQGRSSFVDLLAHYEQLSNQARTSYDYQADISYGQHQRQSFDLFFGKGPIKGLIIYYHAGYWQSRDKSQFHFLAPNYVESGWHFALANYPLCPHVTLQELTEAVLPSLAAIRHTALQGDNLPVILIGHSAGAQIAVELTLANCETKCATTNSVHGVLGISGVYDPEPLITTSLNDNLKLTSATAKAANVTHRPSNNAVPGLWVVGATETNEFVRQNNAQHNHWRKENNSSALIEVENTDHFSVLADVMQWPLGNNSIYNRWLANVLMQN